MASYKSPVNYRSAASRTPTPEPISVVSGVALLAEAPADPGDASTPMVVTVGGQARTRVTSTPTAGQFMVRTATASSGTAFLPVLEFHANDEGLNGTCDYYRTGTVYTAEWFSFLLSFVTPLTGIASKAALDAAYPATTDVTQHGRPGRMAFLTDFSAWFSDGVAWRQVSGNSVTLTAVDALYAGSFGVTADAVASHVAAMTAALTTGATLDAAWVPPGVFTGDIQAAVTLAAALDAAWAGGGLAGAFSAAVTLSDARDAVWAGGASSGPLIPPNPGFERNAIATGEASSAAYGASTTYGANALALYGGRVYASLQAGNLGNTPDVSPTWWERAWWKTDIGGTAGSFVSAEMTGSRVGRVLANAYYDDGEGYIAPGMASLSCRLLKAEMDAGGTLTFDLRVKQNAGERAQISLAATNSGGTLIAATSLALFGSVAGGVSTAIWRSSTTINTTYTFSFDVKAVISALATWANVESVAISFEAADTVPGGGAVEFYLDNFR